MVHDSTKKRILRTFPAADVADTLDHAAALLCLLHKALDKGPVTFEREGDGDITASGQGCQGGGPGYEEALVGLAFAQREAEGEPAPVEVACQLAIACAAQPVPLTPDWRPLRDWILPALRKALPWATLSAIEAETVLEAYSTALETLPSDEDEPPSPPDVPQLSEVVVWIGAQAFRPRPGEVFPWGARVPSEQVANYFCTFVQALWPAADAGPVVDVDETGRFLRWSVEGPGALAKDVAGQVEGRWAAFLAGGWRGFDELMAGGGLPG